MDRDFASVRREAVRAGGVGHPVAARSKAGTDRRWLRACPCWRRSVLSKIMLDWTQCSAVERVPGKVSGAWVFQGTRVPVKALFENLEGGATVDQFLEWFPGVTREQALAVLKFDEVTAWKAFLVIAEKRYGAGLALSNEG